MHHESSRQAKLERPWGDRGTAVPTPQNFRAQLAALTICWLIGIWFHWGNDGIWFQGDSPRHALNAAFFLDLVKDGIWNPIEYAHHYYARYPAITAQRYPPVFYALLAPTFAAFGVSGFVAKCLVQVFALILGVYTLLGIRRWIAAEAGIVAGLVLLMPGTMLWSGAVMLNLPGLVFGVACLFHLRLVLERPDNSQDSKHFCLAFAFAALSILVHPTVGIVIPISGLWLLLDRRWRPFINFRVLATIATCVLVCGSVYWVLHRLSAAQFSQAAISKSSVSSVIRPHFYLQTIPGLVGRWTLPVSLVGLVYSLTVKQYRQDSIRLVLASLLSIALLQCIWAKDERYLLWACPVATWFVAHTFVAAIGIKKLGQHKNIARAISAAGLMALATYLVAIDKDNSPKSVNAFAKLAEHIKKLADGEPILYHGMYDGTFVFYVRSMDEQFRQQVVLVRKLPSRPGQSVEKSVLDWRRHKPNGESQKATVNEEWLGEQITRTNCRWLLLEETSKFKKDQLANRIENLAKTKGYHLAKTFNLDLKTESRKVKLYRIRPTKTGDNVLPVPAIPMAIEGKSYQPVSPR
ncbi:MAG: glycosyltransferase family 39 protein [Rubripirellula sp.]|nr:glycosyltransferase family 39 protein [Rubripirellula sp.]